MAKLYTIGFTKSTAEFFFARLNAANVRTLIDVRLTTGGQLSGFAKDIDLEFFLKKLTPASYARLPILAPSTELLSSYRKKEVVWDEFAKGYLDLLVQRDTAHRISIEEIDGACLLCSESTPIRCHRRLAAEFIQAALIVTARIEIVHL